MKYNVHLKLRKLKASLIVTFLIVQYTWSYNQIYYCDKRSSKIEYEKFCTEWYLYDGKIEIRVNDLHFLDMIHNAILLLQFPVNG